MSILRRKYFLYIIGTRVAALLALCSLCCCTDTDSPVSPSTPEPTPVDGKVAVELALCVSTATGNSSASTRMQAETVQAEGSDYRGIQNLKVYALSNSQQPLGLFTNLASVTGTHHFFKNNIELSIGTKTFLCYAQAVPGTGLSKSENGAIKATYNISDPTQNKFEPVQIAVSTDETEAANITAGYAVANDMATYLTNIATASSAQEWTESALYSSFISNGDYIAGSSANLKALVKQLKTDLQSSSTMEKAKVIKAIGEETNIDTKLSISDPYPAKIGLPDGAAAMTWDDTNKKFVAVTSFNSGTPLSDHTRFVYPPELYYYIDSPIKTATSSLESEYTDATWSNVLAKYTTDDATVSSTTRSVAVKKALDYAVGCLSVYIKTNSYTLEDNSELGTVTFDANRFTLTGIILGGQYKQNYQFTPIEATTNTDEKIVYDHEIPTGITLTTNWSTTPVYTLAFQSRDEKPVDIVLEFINNGDAFTGLGGVVHQNTKFYLVGQIWPESDDPTKTADYYKRVFTKDYVSVVKLTIMSLKNAYNVIPDLKTATYSVKVDNVAVTPWENAGSVNREIYNW